MLNRGEFIFSAVSAAAFPGFATVAKQSSSNVPSYWCTWETQSRTAAGGGQTSGDVAFAGDQGLSDGRDNLGEKALFDSKHGWARTQYPESRADLNLVLDDGWDVGFGLSPSKNCGKFGSMVLNEKRFPSFGGTPPERLRKLVAAAKDCGWRGLGLWVSAQCPGESWGRRKAEDVWKEDLRRKIGWCGEAGVAYLKVDWGAHDGDVAYRRAFSEIAKELAPETMIEHCCTLGVPINGAKTGSKDGKKILRMFSGRWEGDRRYLEKYAKRAAEIMQFSDSFRIYDMIDPIFHVQALERTQCLLRLAEKTGASTYLNVEDVPYLGATLGQALGIMRAGNWVPQNPDVVCRRHRVGEVARAVAWQRIAPPVRTDASLPTIRSDATLTDSWTCRRGDNWYRAADGMTVPQSAPAVTMRGIDKLAEVTDAGEGVPFVLAMRHPNGTLAVGALPRLSDGKGLFTPRAAVYVPAAIGVGSMIGVFGRHASVAFDCMAKPGLFRVTACDLAGKVVHDLTAGCVLKNGRIVLPGKDLEKIGTEAIGDLSEPGALVKLERKNA